MAYAIDTVCMDSGKIAEESARCLYEIIMLVSPFVFYGEGWLEQRNGISIHFVGDLLSVITSDRQIIAII